MLFMARWVQKIVALGGSFVIVSFLSESIFSFLYTFNRNSHKVDVV